MVFAGIQKLTLLDYPEKTACTVFTVGCDFACPFCQNASLISKADGIGSLGKTGVKTGVSSLSYSSGRVRQRTDPCLTDPCHILDFLKTRQGLLDGVCISGGEPLLQDGLESFIDKVKELGFLVKLDTNGSDPDKLRKLIESGKIDFVAMDIKNSPEKYAQTIGIPDYNVAPIEESINILLSGMIPFEFRTTVVKEFHTEEDLLAIAQWISDTHTQAIPNANPQQISESINYYLQKFIDSDGVKQKGLHSYSEEEMQQLINIVKTVLPTAELRGV